MVKRYKSAFRPMRIQARKGSLAEKRYYLRSGLPGGIWPMPKAIAPGIDPAPLDDLMFHGGKVVPQMEFQNVYLGSKSSWHPSDIASIDSEIASRYQSLFSSDPVYQLVARDERHHKRVIVAETLKGEALMNEVKAVIDPPKS